MISQPGWKLRPQDLRHQPPKVIRQLVLELRTLLLVPAGGHPAGLDFGDCFADALAKETGEPLLFKGLDLARTDVRAALPPVATGEPGDVHEP